MRHSFEVLFDCILKSNSKTLFNIKSNIQIEDTAPLIHTNAISNKNTNIVFNKTYPLVDTFSNIEVKNTFMEQENPNYEEYNEEEEEIDLEEYLRSDSLRSVIKI
jgi:hypothetical protein